MKVKVTIKHTQSAIINIGDLPSNLVKDLLTKNEGTFDGNWSISDIGSANEIWAVDSIELEETK